MVPMAAMADGQPISSSSSSWNHLPHVELTAIAAAAAVGIFSLLYLLHFRRRRGERPADKAKAKLPPGPRGIPFLGSLPFLGPLPHTTLHQWSLRYGPIMHLRLGRVPAVVVSSPRAAELFLKTHDLAFASRPTTEYGRIIDYDFKGVGFSPYGPYWRNVRKLCTLELLSGLKVDSFRPMRSEELCLLVDSLKEAAAGGGPINLTKKVADLGRDITCRMVFGRKYGDESVAAEGGFKSVIDDLMRVAGEFNISDYIPWTRSLDLQGVGGRMRVVAKAFDELFDRVIEEHLAAAEQAEVGLPVRHLDFIDYSLAFMDSGDCQFPFDRSNLKAVMSDMLVAAIDTTSTTVQWALSELLKHPHMMEKAQKELETLVGLGRRPDESDLSRLTYLDMVVKETMRLHPAAPLLLPRDSMKDCVVDGLYVPKGSRVIINAWAIGRDPKAWPNPEEFDPERFKGSNVDVRGQDYQLLPFGGGRRGCPGVQMGLTMIRHAMAQLVHCFDWKLPTGMVPTDLDMAEKYGLVMGRATNLWAIPKYRLGDDEK